MSSRHLSALYDALEFLDSLHESNDIKIWSRLLEKIAASIGAETAAYYYFDSLSRQIVPFHRLGDNVLRAWNDPIEIGTGLAGWVAKFHEPALIDDPASDKRIAEGIDTIEGTETRGLLAIPLFVNLDFAGVFEFLVHKGDPFGEADLKFAQTVASRASAAIRLIKLEGMVNRVTNYNASILDNLSGGFLAVDLQGRVMICNPAARKILGVKGGVTDTPVEKALRDIPDLAEALRKTLSTKITVKRQDIEWTLDGEKKILGYSTLLIKDSHGAFNGAGVTFQDITQK